MTKAQSALLWEQSRSEDEDTRRQALLQLAPSLKSKPRSELTAEQLQAVRDYYTRYRQTQRAAHGETLRSKHNAYCRNKIAHDPRYQQKRKAYREAHKEDARAYLKVWRKENPQRHELHRAREMARRKTKRLKEMGEDANCVMEPALDEEFKKRSTRQKDIRAAQGTIKLLASFLARGTKRRDECMQFLHIPTDEEFDEFLEKATEVLPELWEDDDGSLGIGS